MNQQDLNKNRSRNKAVLGSLLTHLLYSTRTNKTMIRNNLAKVANPTEAQAHAVRVLQQALELTESDLRVGKGGKVLDQAYIAKEKVGAEFFKVADPQINIVGLGPGTRTLNR